MCTPAGGRPATLIAPTNDLGARLGSVYQPVQEELARVEAAIHQITEADAPRLSEMLAHVLAPGGKRLRPTVALLAGHFGDYQPDRLVPLAASIELLHTVSLLHDDVIDGAEHRRGRPTANARYHNAAAVVVGDYIFVAAADLICGTANAETVNVEVSIEVLRLFCRTGKALAIGELSQDTSAPDDAADINEYFQRIARKTASLFAACAEAGAMVAQAPPERIAALRDYGENLGMAFQIVDDILDIGGDADQLGKPVGSDLMQGVLTLPVLLLMRRNGQHDLVKRLLHNGRRQKMLAEVRSMIRDSDVLDQSYRVATDFRDRAVTALDPLPDIAAREALVGLANYVVERRS
jgi:geranylgeranyl pyrophosphate synthase